MSLGSVDARFGAKYVRMDKAKFVEDNFWNIWKDMVYLRV